MSRNQHAGRGGRWGRRWGGGTFQTNACQGDCDATGEKQDGWSTVCAAAAPALMGWTEPSAQKGVLSFLMASSRPPVASLSRLWAGPLCPPPQTQLNCLTLLLSAGTLLETNAYFFGTSDVLGKYFQLFETATSFSST